MLIKNMDSSHKDQFFLSDINTLFSLGSLMREFLNVLKFNCLLPQVRDEKVISSPFLNVSSLVIRQVFPRPPGTTGWIWKHKKSPSNEIQNQC